MCCLHKSVQFRKILIASFAFYVLGLLGNGYRELITPFNDVPVLGNIISLYFKIFVTTRNGLFFGFFFVSLGMVLSDSNWSISGKKSFILFLLSAVLMCGESLLVKSLYNLEEIDILFFAIPTALFGFLFLKSIELKNSAIYKTLRTLSTLIFYGHMWVNFIIANLFQILGIRFYGTPIRYLIILCLTILVALFVIRLSDRKKFSWLKKMY